MTVLHILLDLLDEAQGHARDGGSCGLLITLEPPTAAMRRETVDAGTYLPPGVSVHVPRIEIITIEELLQGKKPALAHYVSGPVAEAPRLRRREGRQAALGAGVEEGTPA